jgi:hypothetical protein
LPQASFTPLLLLYLEFFVSIIFWPATFIPAALLIPLCGTAIPGCALRPGSGLLFLGGHLGFAPVAAAF